MKRVIDEIEVGWNGLSLTFGGIYAIPLPREPTDEEIRLILRGWNAGYSCGQHAGRQILQNEFRNLMDVQR